MGVSSLSLRAVSWWFLHGSYIAFFSSRYRFSRYFHFRAILLPTPLYPPFPISLLAHQSSVINQSISLPWPPLTVDLFPVPRYGLLYPVAFISLVLPFCPCLCCSCCSQLFRLPAYTRARDFYHTCYTLSGLSVAQHCMTERPSVTGDPTNELVRDRPQGTHTGVRRHCVRNQLNGNTVHTLLTLHCTCRT